MTKVIDCNICANCDKENDRCKLYGSDPKKAVEMCASKYFGGYRPNCGAKMDAEGWAMNEEARDIAYMLRKISTPNQMLSFPQHACKTASVAADLIESLSAEKEMLNAAIGQLGAIECHRDMLEHELEQVTRERDAAVRDAHGVCRACIHYNGHYPTGDIMSCCKFEECVHGADDWESEDHWQWRGAEVE